MTTTTAAPTWEALVEREPRLGDLLAEARAVRGEGPTFCANAVWYGYPGHRPGLKRRMTRLVGFLAERPDPLLRGPLAYEVAYRALYRALPDCRRCGCPDRASLAS